MTDQILSSLDPFSTASEREFERTPISLTSSLIDERVDIEQGKSAIVRDVGGIINEHQMEI